MGSGRGVGVWVLGIACVVGSLPARAEEAPSGRAPAAGMRAYADPRTGALVPAPPPGHTPQPSPAFSRSSAGLVETRSPNGGVMVDLRGRFQSPLVATVGPDGRVRLHHGRRTE
jgi:hypothetical protein